MKRHWRVTGLALAFLLAGCAAQVAAPRDTEPSPSASAKPSATNATTDVLYIQGSGSGADARIAVIDARTGTVVRELPNGVLSRDRSQLYTTETMKGGTQTQIRGFDLATRTLAPAPVAGSAWNKWQAGGWRSGIVTSADGRWSYSVNTGTEEPSFILALDAVNDRAQRIELPADQSAGFEKAMLWSLVPSNDGKILYAVNPAIGAIDEIAVPAMTVRRTAHLPVSRADSGALAALRQ